MNIDRRELLKCMAALHAAAALPLLASCSRDDALPEGAPFSLWRRVREALRQSPDHLDARAQAIVGTGDLQAIFEFVRDEFALIPWARPNHALRIQAAGYAGRRGVLRSGVATAREKAELLQALLSEAGFDADIVDGDIDIETLGGMALFSSRPRARFAPDAAIAPMERWLEQLGLDQATPPDTMEPDPADIEAMAERLLAAIAPDARGPAFDWALHNGWLPLVRVRQNGASVYANPNVPDAVLGEHYCKREPRPSPVQDAVPTPTLRLSLSMTRRATPRKLESVLEAEWPIGDLIGRRLQLRFLPTQSADDMLSIPLQQLRSFQPAFVVAGTDVTEKDASQLGVSGDILTAEGERIRLDGEDILIDGKTLPLGNSDPALAASVRQIDVGVNTSEYPRIRIEAGLRNEFNEPINGLPLSVFALHHSTQPAAARLIRNMPEAPRIAFALDFSTSLDEKYQQAQLAPVVERMCEAVAGQLPGARFRAGAFSGSLPGKGVSWFDNWSGAGATTAESIRRAAPTAPQTSSYFSALADATNGDANLVVLITDADGAGSDRPETAARISEGCPAVIVGIPGALTRDEHFKRLAELSGGHLFMIDALDRAVESLVELANGITDRPYVFELVADTETEVSPAVRLSVPASGKDAVATYERPSLPVSPVRAISGLFLTVELGRRQVTRRIAGFPLVSTALEALTDDYIEATRLAMFGRFDLSVEAAAPTAAAALDDVLASHLSCEALVTAAAGRDKDEILAATEAGFDRLPESWLALNAPLPEASTSDSVSFQSGYRLVLFSDVPVAAGHYRRKVDILPFSDWHTIGAVDAFAANLRHTLQLSMVEAQQFDDSTVTRVGATDYLLKPNYQLNNWAVTIADEALKKSWMISAVDRGHSRLQHKLLVPEDPSKLAYWEVDTATGAVLGMLPDSSGGASVAETNRRFELLAQVIDAYTQIMQALIATPPGFKIWVELEKAKLEHMKRATIALILMDGTNTSGYGDLLAEQLEGWITDQAQGAVDDALGGVLGGYSEAQEAISLHNQAQQLWGLMTGAES